MILLSLYGETLELVPTGYQYPDGGPTPAVVNRLDIKIGVWTPTEVWSETSPSLFTWDVQRLIAWLRDAAEGIAEPFLSFATPGLAFEFVMGEPERLIRATTEPGTINLLVSRRSLLSAAADLQSEAAAFPERHGKWMPIESEMFEHRFLEWLAASFGIVPEPHQGTGNRWWSFQRDGRDVEFAIVSRIGEQPARWVLRIREPEPAELIACVERHFAGARAIRRRVRDGTIQVQFKSTELTRDFGS